MIFTKDESGNALIARRRHEMLRVEAWGRDSLRVRATMYPEFAGTDWALTENRPNDSNVKIMTENADGIASITNGRIKVTIHPSGVVTIYRDDQQILRERYRNYDPCVTRESRCLKYEGREYFAHTGGDYRLRLRFDANDGEKLFGMGQYQQPNMDLKGCILDLEQRNSQISVPFAVSSLGYGFLWNNPAVGHASFGTNFTEWVADATREMDYWVTVADTPKEILRNYTDVTGHTPQMPENLMGLWQCKLRYRTQEEVLKVARACKEHDVPINVIVIDFFHWPVQGDWTFDEKYWPDPKAMCDELHSMGIKVMVSVWPSVDKRSPHYEEMAERGLLIRTERGSQQCYDYQGDCGILDSTNPETSDYVWEICKKNYEDLGIDMFWLDNSEPDMTKYDFDNIRYHIGTGSAVSNIYPQMYSRIFYDHQKAAGKKEIVNLLRSAWAGSQKYGNVVWSGDVPSTFEAFRDQVAAGLNIGLAGIPWWTTDIGGFMTDDVKDPDFRELLIRWYEFAVFSPVLRMHGDRGPYDIPPLDDRDFGGGYLHTGQDNELWSYGEDNFKIMRDQLDLRLKLHDYIKGLYAEAAENGSPLLRTLFYEFPEDEKSWETYDEYMFGDQYLVAPIFALGARERDVYLPAGAVWEDIRDGSRHEGGQIIRAAAPMESIPVYKKA
ncbi:MAG: glycoside hydrolase family 31 protein [Butyrivibrio sp.]|nr:glycoside hydrolase family 31 protein [Butyrivibrio sp.]